MLANPPMENTEVYEQSLGMGRTLMTSNSPEGRWLSERIVRR